MGAILRVKTTKGLAGANARGDAPSRLFSSTRCARRLKPGARTRAGHGARRSGCVEESFWIGWLAFLLCLAWSAAAVPAVAEDSTAVASLTKKGLTRVGPLWLLGEEVQLRQDLASLKTLEKQFHDAEKKAAESLKRTELLRAELELAREEQRRIGRLLDSSALKTHERQQFADALRIRAGWIDKMQSLVGDVSGPGGDSGLKATLIDLINAHGRLALAVLGIRRNASGLDAAYARLRADGEVVRALKSLGAEQQLGPARNYQRDVKQLSRLDSLVFTGQVPIYRENQRYRLGAIVNERVPATFSYRDAAGPNLIPASLAQAAGINLDKDCPKVVYRGEGGREIPARLVKLPSLRIGRCVLENVEAYALPPEGEDIGAELSVAAFQGYRVELDLRQLRLAVRPSAKP
ncbi:MAG: retropepsin-like aspartic protease [Pirellulales bacterium]